MSLPKPEPVNDVNIGMRFYDMTGGIHPADRPDDSYWFKLELLKGSLVQEGSVRAGAAQGGFGAYGPRKLLWRLPGDMPK